MTINIPASITVADFIAGRLAESDKTQREIAEECGFEKAVAYPTDSRLLKRGRQHLVKLAGTLGITLRQNYNREVPRLAAQVGRYAHAKQYRRMKATLKSLRTVVGRVWRDIERKLDRQSETLAAKASCILARVKRLLEQKPKDKNKLYSLHAPEVECISKGKARQPYEFGVKVTVATTHKEGLVVGMRSLPGNPYDGHTLPKAIEQVSLLTAQKPKAVFVDKGYRGVSVEGVTIWRSGQKRGVTPSIKTAIHRRSAIEPAIGHMKNEGKLRRNWLKGTLGDALNAVLCGAGHNLRMILRALRLFCAWILCACMADRTPLSSPKPRFGRFATA